MRRCPAQNSWTDRLDRSGCRRGLLSVVQGWRVCGFLLFDLRLDCSLGYLRGLLRKFAGRLAAGQDQRTQEATKRIRKVTGSHGLFTLSESINPVAGTPPQE